MPFTKQEIGDGVRLHLCDNSRYKTITVKIFIQQEISEEHVTQTAIIPFLLLRQLQYEEFAGVSFKGDIIKTGDLQIIEFSMEMVLPEFLPYGQKMAKTACKTLWKQISDPELVRKAFNKKDFELERLALKNRLNDRVNDRSTFARYRATRHIGYLEEMKIHQYGLEGYFEQLEVEEVYEYYKELIRYHPIDIFIVGKGVERLAKVFDVSGLNRKAIKRLTVAEEIPRGTPIDCYDRHNVEQGICLMCYRTGLSYADDEFFELVVLSGVYSRFSHSKLFVHLRERATLCERLHSFIEPTKGYLMAGATINVRVYGSVLRVMDRQLEAIELGKITPAELENTKKALIRELICVEDNPVMLIYQYLIAVINQKVRSVEEKIDLINQVTITNVQKRALNLTLDTIYLFHGVPRRRKK